MTDKLLCLFLTIALSAAFLSCKEEEEVADNVIVTVYDKALTIQEVNSILPDKYNAVDSADIVDRYINEWINKELILKNAELNVGSDPEIEQMVKDYRNSLMVSKYTELLVDQKFENEINEKDIANYYNNNLQSFVLSEQILSGIFFKIPIDAPKLNDLKKWSEKRSEEDLLELEEYCMQNAQIYEDFRNKWLSVRNITTYLTEVPDERSLRQGVTLEQTDSLSRYYVLVFDSKTSGETAPLMFVRKQIEKILTHKNKLNYIASFKKDIYNEAIKNKNIIYNDEK